ncbi:ATP-dependent 6-phosphofructokinase isozyme 2 [Aliiroseovarius pelagivivens]|uniref:Phosphofructokinase n=1 Tax=Aliiroseovarius pelagivivens TaxID=1639690 RepID=A0A2R8AL96_9RHOB|nr:ATP-dependent 6-phosphofructokinase isozyme 2 [Aliiroseovarius pelagivivens]
MNVARAVIKLGGNAKAFVVVGGAMGDRLLDLLSDENMPVLKYRVAGETGYSLAVTDEKTEQQFRFTLPGDPLNAGEGRMLLDQISRVVPANGLVVLSGGLAAGLADDFPQEVQEVVQQRNARLIVDTSKAPLQRLIDAPRAPMDFLRLDRSEIETAFAKPLRSIADNLYFTQELVRRGVAKTVVTGHGDKGSIMVSGDKKFFCHAPKVEVRSKIGAGDALVGAYTLSLSRGAPPEEALKWGVAAAAATVGTDGTALCNLAETEALFPQCQLESL